jgi:hypothetical protein
MTDHQFQREWIAGVRRRQVKEVARRQTATLLLGALALVGGLLAIGKVWL